MTEATAPGKIILFGEHAVVYGRPAIAAPVSQIRAKAVVSDNPGGGVRLMAPDIGTDGGKPDPADLDEQPDLQPDQGDPIDWPEYSGVPCNVDGTPGRCLPTSECDGTATPGHCPGPAEMQCCTTECSAGGEQGVCTAQAICGSAEPSTECSGPAGVGCCAPGAEGTFWGEAWNTYYYLSAEADYDGADDTTLFDANCDPLAEVPAEYSDAVCIEGSGVLEDGTVINYASTCDCGRPCPTGGTVCWKALDPATHPWGEGAFGNALVPLRSLAVDRDEIPLRTSIYLPKFDGVEVPAIGGVDAFTHDGCFRADDVGGAIEGEHIDIFAGPEEMWRHFEGIFPTRTNFDIYLNVAKCM